MERTSPRFASVPSLEPLPAPRSSSRHVRRPWWKIPVLWTIYQYLAGEILRVTLLGVLAVSLLYTVLAAYQAVRSGLLLHFIWPLLTKTFAYPLYYSIPIALLFAITLVFGRLTSDLEVAALRTHGVSHAQIFAPVVALGIALCAVAIHVTGWVVPDIHYEKRNLQAYILDQLESLGSGVNRTLLLPDDAGTLWVGAYEGTDLWHVDIDLQIRGHSHLLPELRGRLPERLPTKVKILARQGELELLPDRTAILLRLKGVDVLVPEAMEGNERFHHRFTISENVVIPLSFAPKSPGVKDRTSPELLAYIEELEEELRRLRIFEEHNLAYAAHRTQDASSWRKKSRKQLARRIAGARTEFHRRVAFSLSCLTFPLIGIGLTLLLQRWNRLVPFFLANILVIGVFYPLLMVGVALGEGGFVPPLAMALPNVIMLALGIFLLRRVVRQ